MKQHTITTRLGQLSGILLVTAIIATTPAMLCAADSEDSEAMQALREELDQTRQQLAESARHLAEISRKLGASGGLSATEFDFDMDLGELTRIVMQAHGGDSEHQLSDVIARVFRSKPQLGVLLANQDDSDPRRVIAVTPASGAERAGIQVDDVIVAINATDIPPQQPERMREVLAAIEPGSKVQVKLLRNGEPLELAVETSTIDRDMRIMVKEFDHIDELLQSIAAMTDKMVPDLSILPLARTARHFSLLGPDLDLIKNHPGLIDYFGTADGVLVLRVSADHPLGLKAGDVILSVDDESIEDPLELGQSLFELQAGDPITLQLMRHGELIQLDATAPERPHQSRKIRRLQQQIKMNSASADSSLI